MPSSRTSSSPLLVRVAACLSLLTAAGCAASSHGDATMRAGTQQQAYASVYTNPGAASLQTSGTAVVSDTNAPPPSYATQAAQFEQVGVIDSSYAEPTQDLPNLVGYENLSSGDRVPVVVYVHTYPDPVETYARVRWSGRWYYNVQGSLVYWSEFYGGWVAYYSPPIYLTWAWNWHYPWISYGWGCGYYGCGWYWGGAGYYGWHAYGRPPGWYRPGVRYPPNRRPATAGRPSTPGVPSNGGSGKNPGNPGGGKPGKDSKGNLVQVRPADGLGDPSALRAPANGRNPPAPPRKPSATALAPSDPPRKPRQPIPSAGFPEGNVRSPGYPTPTSPSRAATYRPPTRQPRREPIRGGWSMPADGAPTTLRTPTPQPRGTGVIGGARTNPQPTTRTPQRPPNVTPSTSGNTTYRPTPSTPTNTRRPSKGTSSSSPQRSSSPTRRSSSPPTRRSSSPPRRSSSPPTRSSAPSRPPSSSKSRGSSSPR